jgi:uroporphyrinogen decarboxylase
VANQTPVPAESNVSNRATRFLRACRRESVDCTPIWLMRQAGRYLPEYRAIRQNHPFLTMVKTPELAVEVTLQPIRRFELDAAIIFADILPPLAGMGLPLEFNAGEGPHLSRPITCAGDVESLATPPAEEALGFTLEAIRQTRRELNGIVPLIGFSGAPFTLASYAIEGGGSKEFHKTKALMYGQPKVWHRLMEKLAIVVGDYLRAQVQAGAQVLQLFDSWVGALSPADYAEFVLPHTKRALQMASQANLETPLIYFGTGNGGFLPLFAQAGGTVIGVDWRSDIAEVAQQLGTERAIQGNLDPVVLQAPLSEIERQAARILDSLRGRAGHIFNIGHGIHKETPPEHVGHLVDFVHRYSATPRA